MSKKYCPALVVMLYTVLEFSHKSICTTTCYPSSAVGNIISRKIGTVKERGHVVRSRWSRYEKNGELVDHIESDYVNGVSTYEIQEKYGVHHATVSEWMRKRGHHRGKGGGAVKRMNQARHDEAVKKFFAEFGSDITSNSIRHAERRRIRMENAPRDYGITWKALAKRNNSMKCEICGIECDPNDKRWGSSGPTHPSVDHVIEICKGGTDTWDNVRLACCACNIGRNKVIANA